MSKVDQSERETQNDFVDFFLICQDIASFS